LPGADGRNYLFVYYIILLLRKYNLFLKNILYTFYLLLFKGERYPVTLTYKKYTLYMMKGDCHLTHIRRYNVDVKK
jgi:hypothetical protein